MLSHVLRASIAAVVLAAAAAPAQISLVTSANTSNHGHTSNASCDEAYRSTLVVNSNATSITARYAASCGADCGCGDQDRTYQLNADWKINFNVTCPVGFRLNINTSLAGAFTHVGDTNFCAFIDPAETDLTAITGIYSGGGTLAGSLGLADPGGIPLSAGTQNVAFSNSGNGIVTGISHGGSAAQELRFSWSGKCRSRAAAGRDGGEACVRMGLEVTDFGAITCDDYPGQGGRNAANDGHFVNVSASCLCGNGVNDGLTAGEQCDDGPLNGTAQSCCTSDCKLHPDGFPCDDGQACTNSDSCDAGACIGFAFCSPTPTVTPLPTPTPIPASCPFSLSGPCKHPVSAGKSVLVIKAKPARPAANKVTWKWAAGEAVSPDEAGDPVNGGTSYAFCVYDASNTLLFDATLPAVSGWSLRGGRPSFKDKLLQQEGVKVLKIKSGTAGKSSVVLAASNKNGSLGLSALPMYGSLPLTAQLWSSDGTCWEASYAVPAKNQGGASALFKAKGQ